MRVSPTGATQSLPRLEGGHVNEPATRMYMMDMWKQ